MNMPPRMQKVTLGVVDTPAVFHPSFQPKICERYRLLSLPLFPPVGEGAWRRIPA